MVAIFTGQGAGFDRGSASVLGGQGLLGSGAQGIGGDVVSLNAATGNLLINRQDEFLVGRGPDVSLSRTYNGLGQVADENGDRWRFNFDRRVYGLTGTASTAGSTIKRIGADGAEILYTWDASKTAYVAKGGGGSYDTLVQSGADWLWTDGDSRVTERYSAYGTTYGVASFRLVSVADVDGNSLTLTYAADKLSRIATADGSYVDYIWTGNNVTQLTTGYTDLGGSVAKTLVRTRYTYDASNRLATVVTDLSPNDGSVADGKSYTTTYAYDASGRVSTISQSDGSLLTVTYDASNRVASLVQTVASGVTRTTSLAYGAGFTSVTDATGQVTRLDYDSAGNLTKVTAPPAAAGGNQQIVQFAYNANGDLATVTDALGKVSSFAYDSNGNVTQSTDRLGNVVTRTYGTKNELLTETRTGSDASGNAVNLTTRYAYDIENHLRFVVTPEGRVTEFSYNAVGQNYWTVTYPQSNYDVSALPASTALTEGQLATWRSSIDNSQSQISQSFFDARGNVTLTRAYGQATVAWGYLDTSDGYVGSSQSGYTYDQAGRLLNRQVSGQSAETFVYDGLGRLTASVDLNGGTTSYVFNDAATTTTVTMASGYAVTNVYNKAGDLVSSTDASDWSPSGTISNSYDKLGRLRVSTDPLGNKSYAHYDAAGRKVADINHLGDLLEYRYDANNRIVATARYMLRVTAANLTSLANADNTLTINDLRPASHVSDLWTWTVYDNEGQVSAAIDGDGGVTTYGYDASGRQIIATAYANKLGQALIDSYKVSAPTLVTLPTGDASRDAVSRTFYDRDGLVVGALDGEGYLTRSEYDKAGRLVAQTAFANATGSAVAVNRAAASFNQLVASIASSADDRTTRSVYDGRGQLRYAIDALGYVTEFVYATGSAWSSNGLVRSTIRHATAISTTNFSLSNVKALVASNAANAANRSSWTVYDASGRVAYSVNAEGGVTGFTYDTSGRVIKTVEFATNRLTNSLPDLATMDAWRTANVGNAANRISRVWYTKRGEVRFQQDAEGYITEFNINANGKTYNSIKYYDAVTLADGSSISTVSSSLSNGYYANRYVINVFSYDALGRLISTTDGEGVITTNSYNAVGLLIVTDVASGSVDMSRTIYAYDNAGRVRYEYRAHGTPEQQVFIYYYDGLGNRTAVTDPRGTTNYTYDRNGNVKTQSNMLAGTTSFEYNGFGEAWKITGPNGASSYSWFDRLGRTMATRDAANYVDETSYTAFGEVASATRRYLATSGTPVMATRPAVTAHANDATSTFLYDKLGRAVRATDALGFFETYSYDALGNLASKTAKSANVDKVTGATTSYTYDRRGLLLTETLPRAAYNNEGTLLAATVVNRYEYDSRGNRSKSIEADNLAATEKRTTSFVYDKNDRLVQTTGQEFEGQTPISSIRYDGRGNVTGTTDPVGARTSYFYDDLGRKTVEINALGVATAYSYDLAGNLSEARVYAAPVASPLDGGSAAEAPALSGAYRSTTYSYDNLGRRLTTSVSGIATGTWNGTAWAADSSAITTQYQYDSVGNIVKLTAANGSATWSYYDARGLKTAEVDAENYLTLWTYDADGNVTLEHRLTNKVGTQNGLAPSVGLTVQQLVDSAGYNLNDRMTAYTYDAAGQRVSEARYNVQSFDTATNAHTAWAGSHVVVSFQYNGLGQVVTKTEATGDTSTYQYDGSGRLVTETRAAFVDQGGVTVTPTTQYLYDGLNNLSRTRQVGTANAADRVTRYGYSGGVLRWVQDAAAQTTLYFHDVAGRVTYQYYTRLKSDGTQSAVYEGQRTTYDLLGRSSETWQAYNNTGAWIDDGPRTSTTYNAFGEVTSIAVGGVVQQQNQYDNAGRLVASTGADGVWKHFGYDKLGNQTIAITSAGENLSGHTFAQALAKVGQGNVNATYTVYDKRNMAISVVEEGRQLNGTTTQNLTTSRTYSAFGDMLSETNAAGATINYTYNTIGRMIRSEGPTVEMTLEDGSTRWIRPTEDFYYDKSGRLVAKRDANGTYATGGTSTNGTTKAADTGNLTKLTLLAGSGYDGSEALVTSEIHADGGIKQTKYDVFGDARTLIDEIGRQATRVYDGAGRVIQATSIGGLTDYYAYDVLGQQIKHWNSFLGATEVETTDYDRQGRVVASRAFGGDITTVSYVWDATITTTGIGTFGGWTETTTMANGLTSVEKSDLAGRVSWKSNLWGNATTFAYDIAGRQTGSSMGGMVNAFTYYNTGQIATMSSGTSNAGSTTSDWSQTVASYSYDAAGNRVSEYLVSNVGDYSAGYTFYWAPGEPDYVLASYVLTTSVLKNATATFDSLGRLKSWNQAETTATATVAAAPGASTTNAYDANGNIRRTTATFSNLDANGASTGTQTRDYWFRYDAMNRLVTDKGTLSGAAGAAGTTIVRGATMLDALGGAGGKDIQYDEAGQRKAVVATEAYVEGYLTYYRETRENYAYDGGGRISQISTSTGAGALGTYDPVTYAPIAATPPAAPAGGTVRSSFTYDLLGRQTAQTDNDAAGIAISNRTAYFNAKGQLTSDSNWIKKADNKTYTTSSTYYYTDYNSGQYQLGSVAWFQATSSVSGTSGTTTSRTINTYAWFDSALQSSISYDSDVNSGSNPVYNTQFQYNGLGILTGVAINDGKPRNVAFTNDELGQIIRRDETRPTNAPVAQTGSPHEIWYRYGGRQLGYTGNNGTSELSTGGSIDDRRTAPLATPGTYRNGNTYGGSYADFAQSYDAVNSFSQGSAGGSYTVRAGETLQAIAQNLWGDANLWYKIAEANGMSGAASLREGQTLILPAGVLKNAHNAGTTRPYDPSEAIGDLSPTTPKPPKKNKCAVVGQLISMVVAIAVTTFLGAIPGNIASQGVNMLFGLQDGFSFKSLAMATVTAAVTAGIGDKFATFAKGTFGAFTDTVNTAARAVATSAISQGIGVATGLQDKFSFAGVAAAGISAGIGRAAGLHSFSGKAADLSAGNVASHIAVGAARTLANAATRSALEGSNFGDNVRFGMADVLAQVAVDAVSGAMANNRARRADSSGGSSSAGGEGGGAGQFNGNVLLGAIYGETPGVLSGPTLTAPIIPGLAASEWRLAYRSASPEQQAAMRDEMGGSGPDGSAAVPPGGAAAIPPGGAAAIRPGRPTIVTPARGLVPATEFSGSMNWLGHILTTGVGDVTSGDMANHIEDMRHITSDAGFEHMLRQGSDFQMRLAYDALNGIADSTGNSSVEFARDAVKREIDLRWNAYGARAQIEVDKLDRVGLALTGVMVLPAALTALTITAPAAGTGATGWALFGLEATSAVTGTAVEVNLIADGGYAAAGHSNYLLDDVTGYSGVHNALNTYAGGTSLLTGGMRIGGGWAHNRYMARAVAERIPTFRNLAPLDEIVPARVFPTQQVQRVGYTGKLDYVVLESGELVLGRSGHISLSQGADVLAAGEARFHRGAVKRIDNMSGHYRPVGASAQSAAEAAFNRSGFDATGRYVERTFP